MPLTDIAVKQAKPQDKNFKLSDAGGLFLLVKPNGGKCWRLKYRYAGKEKLLALGVYPEAKLVRARELAAEAKQRLRNGIDPGEVRKVSKAANVEAVDNSFEAVGLE